MSDAVNEVFDLRPCAIIEKFNLRSPIYFPLASYGQMGREDLNVGWEKTDKVIKLKEIVKKIESQLKL